MRNALEQVFQAGGVCVHACACAGWGVVLVCGVAMETQGSHERGWVCVRGGPGRQAEWLGAQAPGSHSEEFGFPGKGCVVPARADSPALRGTGWMLEVLHQQPSSPLAAEPSCS